MEHVLDEKAIFLPQPEPDNAISRFHCADCDAAHRTKAEFSRKLFMTMVTG